MDPSTRIRREGRQYEIDAVSGTVDALTTEELDIDGSDFVATGEFVPIGPTINFSGGQDNTSSSSYSDLSNPLIGTVNWAKMFPSGTAVALLIHHQPKNANSDQLDVRVRNKSQSETILEVTGITSDAPRTDGPQPYSPTTRDSNDTISVQARNGDNSTTVGFNDALVQLGVQL